MTEQQKHHAYKLIRQKELSACLSYLLSLSLTKPLRTALQQMNERHTQLRAQTDLRQATQVQALQLEEEYYLREVEALLEQKKRPLAVFGWAERKDYLLYGSGALVVLMAVFFVVKSCQTSPSPREMTIHVRDRDGNAALSHQGTLTITPTGSHRSFVRAIEQDGKVDFSDLSPALLGDSLTIGLKADCWHLDGPRRMRYDGSALTVYVAKDSTWGWIRGRVTERSTGRPIAGAYVQVDDCMQALYYSDSLGRFDVVLPRACWLEVWAIGYTVRVHHPDYSADHESGHDPRSSGFQFQLTKQ